MLHNACDTVGTGCDDEEFMKSYLRRIPVVTGSLSLLPLQYGIWLQGQGARLAEVTSAREEPSRQTQALS